MSFQFEYRKFRSKDDVIEYALDIYKAILEDITEESLIIKEYANHYNFITPFYLEEKIRDRRNKIQSLHRDAYEILSNLDHFLFKREGNENEEFDFK